jgi:hypothetical protein
VIRRKSTPARRCEVKRESPELFKRVERGDRWLNLMANQRGQRRLNVDHGMPKISNKIFRSMRYFTGNSSVNFWIRP